MGWVRPVHADDSTRYASDGCQITDRDSRGVGGQDYIVADLGLEILEDLLLECLLLRNGLYNKARPIQGFREVSRGGNARASGVRVLCGHESAAGQDGVDEVDSASRFLELLRLHIENHSIETIAGERRRHARAHRTGADDGDFFN